MIKPKYVCSVCISLNNCFFPTYSRQCICILDQLRFCSILFGLYDMPHSHLFWDGEINLLCILWLTTVGGMSLSNLQIQVGESRNDGTALSQGLKLCGWIYFCLFGAIKVSHFSHEQHKTMTVSATGIGKPLLEDVQSKPNMPVVMMQYAKLHYLKYSMWFQCKMTVRVVEVKDWIIHLIILWRQNDVFMTLKLKNNRCGAIQRKYEQKQKNTLHSTDSQPTLCVCGV